MKNSIEYDIQIGYQLESELNKELGQITAKTECITFATDFGDSKKREQFGSQKSGTLMAKFFS